MITVTHILPDNLVKAPAVISSLEMERLMTVPTLQEVTVQAVSASYLRRLAKKANVPVRVQEQGAACRVVRITAPRGMTQLEVLDSQILWHSKLLAALVEDRAKTLQEGLADALTAQEAEEEEEEPPTEPFIEEVPSEVRAEDFDLNKILGE